MWVNLFASSLFQETKANDKDTLSWRYLAEQSFLFDNKNNPEKIKKRNLSTTCGDRTRDHTVKSRALWIVVLPTELTSVCKVASMRMGSGCACDDQSRDI